jgi:hypothetical protein
MPVKIHPVIIYPFTDPFDAKFVRKDLEYLYEKLAALIAKDHHQYERPITVVNRQTINNSKQEEERILKKS